MKHFVLLALGANLGDRKKNIGEAVRLLLAGDSISGIRCSSLYLTAPVGYTDQPPFLNAAVSGMTGLSAEDLLHECKAIEKKIGRIVRPAWHEREIDLDILLFGPGPVHRGDIHIPHPRMQDRRFVLVPAAEIAGGHVHPVLGKTLAQLLEECPDNAAVEFFDRMDCTEE